jgi:hypothetical protein
MRAAPSVDIQALLLRVLENILPRDIGAISPRSAAGSKEAIRSGTLSLRWVGAADNAKELIQPTL